MRTAKRRFIRCGIVALGVWSLGWRAEAAAAPPLDPLLPMLRRIDNYVRHQAVEDVKQDPRYAVNPTELVRLSIVCQLLAYCELYACESRPAHYRAIVERADFLLANFDTVSSRGAFDGMLGAALLEAYDVTGDDRYVGAASLIAGRCMRLRDMQNTLNWGLMSTMTLARFYRTTGIRAVLDRTRQIVRSLETYQNADGSFPHYCPGSKDVGYTSWMGMELVLLKRFVDEPLIDSLLAGIDTFLVARVGPGGGTLYEGPCPDYPGCWEYYYSIATGCGNMDYDTRAWTGELGHTVVVLDHFGDAEYFDVIGFLAGLEDRGAFPDKWDYFATPEDPIYIWGSADRSLIRTSLIFWSLAALHGSRVAPVARRSVRRYVPSAAEMQWLLAEPEDTRPLARQEGGRASLNPMELAAPTPNPAVGSTALRVSLVAGADVRLAIFDVCGRRVRDLLAGRLPAGDHRVVWDCRDARGNRVSSGVYLISLCAGGETRSQRLVVLP